MEEDTAFVIWTTTPWTLPANQGIAVNPTFTYVLVEADGRKFVVAKDLMETVQQAIGWETVTVLKEFAGQEMEYMTATHPFYDRESLVILGDHVTLMQGTGLVHTAPGHGKMTILQEIVTNYLLFSLLILKVYLLMKRLDLKGSFMTKQNPMITDLLQEKGALLKLDFFTHSYPHDWRTKNLSFIVQHHNGLLRSMISAKTFLMKWKKLIDHSMGKNTSLQYGT